MGKLDFSEDPSGVSELIETSAMSEGARDCLGAHHRIPHPRHVLHGSLRDEALVVDQSANQAD